MSAWKKLASAPAASEGLDIPDVFSSYLYTGDGTNNRSITTNIDTDTEGGLVWIKNRTGSFDHELVDSERGDKQVLRSNRTGGEYNDNNAAVLTSTGFTISGGAGVNGNGDNFVAWTFRKAPKFFDVVTYTGNGTSGRTISHNLGSVPGCIMVKRRDTSGDWCVYHRALDATAPENYTQELNGNVTRTGGVWNDTAPTSSVFSVNNDARVNANGATYVAYVFAHHDGDGTFGPDSDQDIISCGSYTGDSSPLPEVDAGFEPQFIIIKRAEGIGDWWMFDAARGFTYQISTTGSPDKPIYANSTLYETTGTYIRPYESNDGTVKGFQPQSTSVGLNGSGDKYIYIAIRNGTLFPPTSGTEVLDFLTWSGDNSSNRVISGANFSPDVSLLSVDNVRNFEHGLYNRVTGTEVFDIGDTTLNSQYTASHVQVYHDYNAGLKLPSNAYQWNANFYDYQAYFLKRAPHFMDIRLYEGDTNAQNITHGLGVAPEMILFKGQQISQGWFVYHKDLGQDEYLVLHDNSEAADLAFLSQYMWNQSSPTSTTFPLGATGSNGPNRNSYPYVAWLFATASGVSKVGSYTGNGTNQNVDCGFSSGARFILIKCADTYASDPESLHWYLFDTERGIVAGADTHSVTDKENWEWKSYDAVDPYSSGFNVVQEGNTNINLNGLKYIFLAIA